MQLLPNTFTLYSFTSEEEIIANTFSEIQLARLRNELALVAQEKVNLKYDPEHPMQFLQQEAELQGKMGVLNYLIQAHEASVDDFMRLQLAAQQTQQD